MNNSNSNTNFWTSLITVLLAGAIIKVIFDILSESKTDVISDKGLQAINDPNKKKIIDEAFEAAEKKQRETGIWENPVVDLS